MCDLSKKVNVFLKKSQNCIFIIASFHAVPTLFVTMLI